MVADAQICEGDAHAGRPKSMKKLLVVMAFAAYLAVVSPASHTPTVSAFSSDEATLVQFTFNGENKQTQVKDRGWGGCRIKYYSELSNSGVVE